MQYSAEAGRAPMFFNHVQAIGPSIAAMNDDGFLRAPRESHLVAENTRLRFARRMIVVIVESDFSPRDDFRMLSQPRQFFQVLARLAQHPKVIAWGEIGLDYYYDHSPREAQARVFRDQMALARRAKKPIIIHCRDAWTDCLNMIEEHWRPTGLGGILHCFTGTLDDARRGMDMGFLISFAGNSTYPKTQNLRDVAKALPLEKILIETDAPYLAPQPYRGKRNEPAYVAEVARTLATVRDLTPEEIAAATTENFRRFFGLAQPASLAASGLKADE